MSVLSYIETPEARAWGLAPPNSFWSRTECRIILPIFRVFCIEQFLSVPIGYAVEFLMSIKTHALDFFDEHHKSLRSPDFIINRS